MSTTHDVGFEEKQVYDATIQDVPSDGASSIDTITALVNEGTSTIPCFQPTYQQKLTLSFFQTTPTKSNSEPCHGKKPPGCSAATKSV